MSHRVWLDELPIRGSARMFVGREHGDAVSVSIIPGVPVGW
jgi:hypothetical protein